jgi:hypothetical protein
MSIDAGNAEPISSAPYYASPAGRRMMEVTIAELLAGDVIEEFDLLEHHQPFVKCRFN